MNIAGIGKGYFDLLPGTGLAALVALAAIAANSLYPPVSAVALAMIGGLLLRNLLGIPSICLPGVKFSVKRILRLAIILLGVRLSFIEVLRTGGSVITIIIICIATTLLLVTLLARRFSLPPRLGTLIAVGTSICGNSAIMATSPVIGAEEEEVSFSVATITLFGVLAVFIYPFLGHLLALADTMFGMWAGTAINDTSQVVTAGFIYSEESGNIATVVKMTRNLFMAPVIILISLLYSRRHGKNGKSGKIDWKKAFPLFVLGFLLMAILRSLDVFPPVLISLLKNTAEFFIVVAIAALGMGTDFSSMKKMGLRPFYVGLAASFIMGIISITLIQLLT